ncbi:hypothetical protein J751_3614 [Acinetobacter baumannii 24812_8]|nr:hypothetical protein J751_3614 [Acinetobacter baumannii 24812_8]
MVMFESLVDMREMVVSQMEGDRRLMVRMFLKVGQKEINSLGMTFTMFNFKNIFLLLSPVFASLERTVQRRFWKRKFLFQAIRIARPPRLVSPVIANRNSSKC